MGWKLCRRGITRTVLLAGRWAVKVPSLRPRGAGLPGMLWGFCRGVLANQSERTWWRHATDDMRPHLCPVLHSWLGGIINVYPRCEPFLVDAVPAAPMLKHQNKPNTHQPPPGDTNPEKKGWLDGRVVLLDYDMGWNGCPHDVSGAFNRLAQDTPESAPYASRLAAYQRERVRDRERLAALMDWCAVDLGNSLVHHRIRFFLGVPDDAFPWQLDGPDKIEVIGCEDSKG